MSFNNITENEIKIFYTKVSKNVKKYRLMTGISQMELALEIDIKSVAFFSNAENNRYNKHFNMEHIYKISNILNIDICEFFK